MVEAQVVGLMKMPVGFVNMCRLDRAGPVTPRSTIGMKDAEVLVPSKSINCAESLFTKVPRWENAAIAALPRPKEEQRKEAQSALDENTIM
jgi:hypothetical protein